VSGRPGKGGGEIVLVFAQHTDHGTGNQLIVPIKQDFIPPHQANLKPARGRKAAAPRGLGMYCRGERRGGTARRFKRARRSHFSMSPKLEPVLKGRMWRVQIIQPNGSVRYFGRFTSENRAREWITAHAWLTVPNNGD
jgi:hypothetical protein